MDSISDEGKNLQYVIYTNSVDFFVLSMCRNHGSYNKHRLVTLPWFYSICQSKQNVSSLTSFWLNILSNHNNSKQTSKCRNKNIF